jgi:CheY-like chemotaxis protein
MELESEIGRGSTFTFTVRLVEQPQPRPPLVKRSDLTDVRVLIVDDNATNRTILERQTRSWGMVSETAASGTEGLRMLVEANAAERPFRLGLLDMDMPEMDGIAMAKAANGIESLTALPLLLLTSSSRRETGESIRAAGFAASLTKPGPPIPSLRRHRHEPGHPHPDPTPEAPDVGPFTATVSTGPGPACSSPRTTPSTRRWRSRCSTGWDSRPTWPPTEWRPSKRFRASPIGPFSWTARCP